MGKCQQTWLDYADFVVKECGSETERREDDRFMCEACLRRRIGFNNAMAEKMVCPRCFGELVFVPAREAHPSHAEHDLARKCSKDGCTFICTMGDEGPRPVRPIYPGLPATEVKP
jgi:hypothetical protein